MERNNHIRTISGVMLIMLVGKLLSLVANQAYLSYFGAENEQLNIFSWALQIPNYLFQSIGTALASVVVPVFAALRTKGEYERANRFASNLITVSTLLTLALVVVGWLLSGVLPRFTEFQDKAYGAMALRLLMPVMVFYSLSYIYQGILQSMDRFRSAALVNLPSGIVIILYLLLLADRFGVTGLLITVVVGLFCQCLVLVLPARRAGFHYQPVLDLRDEGLRRAGKMTPPIILGASAYQINMFFNNTLMSNVAPSSVSLFNFVQTLILSSVMTLVLAITSVAYPKLTEYAARKDMAGFRGSLNDTVSGLLYLLVPISVGLICLGTPLLRLISMYGKVSAQNITTEYYFLVAYCLCIPLLGMKEIVDRAFYSLQWTRDSAVTGGVILVVNVILGYVFSIYTPLGAYGIPLGYSLAVIVGTSFLIWRLRRRIGPFMQDVASLLLKTCLSAGAMWAVVRWIYGGLSGMVSDSVAGRLILVLLPTAAGAVFFFVVTFLLKTPPICRFVSGVMEKKRGNG